MYGWPLGPIDPSEQLPLWSKGLAFAILFAVLYLPRRWNRHSK
jgi:hypothetical protein